MRMAAIFLFVHTSYWLFARLACNTTSLWNKNARKRVMINENNLLRLFSCTFFFQQMQFMAICFFCQYRCYSCVDSVKWSCAEKKAIGCRAIPSSAVLWARFGEWWWAPKQGATACLLRFSHHWAGMKVYRRLSLNFSAASAARTLFCS